MRDAIQSPYVIGGVGLASFLGSFVTAVATGLPGHLQFTLTALLVVAGITLLGRAGEMTGARQTSLDDF